MLTKQTVAQVKAHVKKHGEWVGHICPSKCYPNPKHPFNTAREVRVIASTDGEAVVRNTYGETFTLDAFVNNFSYYNCNNELGNTVHYYKEG